MKLHFLRHAKTNQSSPTGNDFDRELLPKGIEQAKQISEYLSSLNGVEIYCSSAKRTRQTFDLISSKLPSSNVHFSQDIYLCSSNDLMSFVNKIQHNKETLIIGHNNGISDFISYLCDEFVSLRTSEYCCVEFECKSWSEISKGLGKIIANFRPEVN